jgi:hypothetical protein
MKLSEMYAVEKDHKRKCFNCGEVVGQGGYWMGAGHDVAVCPDEQCVEGLIHIAIDSLLDGPLSGVNPETQRKDISEMITRVVRQKLRY